jgi:hypothetical protein
MLKVGGICPNPAIWYRVTQFSGEHPYCEEHAKKEADFGEGNSSFFWTKMSKESADLEGFQSFKKPTKTIFIPSETSKETPKPPGYHLADIKRGSLGEVSKIREEVDELQDAVDQDCKIMQLVELSDLYGAIQRYLIRHHPGITMSDLKIMSGITARAFRNGHR